MAGRQPGEGGDVGLRAPASRLLWSPGELGPFWVLLPVGVPSSADRKWLLVASPHGKSPLSTLAVSATPGSPWSGVGGADGPTIRPPTGPLSVALGTEGLVSTRRRASRWLALSGFGGPVWGLRGQCWWGQSVGGALPQHSPQAPDRKRVSRADGKETALPFGEKWRIPSGPDDRAVSPPPSPRRLLLLVFLRMTRQSGQ